MRWADIEDDDCLTCEKCGLKEWTRAYCVNCVNDTLQIMNLFQDHTDLSESAKERLYCQIVTEHRLTACAPHPGTENLKKNARETPQSRQTGSAACPLDGTAALAHQDGTCPQRRDARHAR